jgi:hypothetical protein
MPANIHPNVEFYDIEKLPLKMAPKVCLMAVLNGTNVGLFRIFIIF